MEVIGAVYKYVSKFYGGPCREQETTFTVGTAAVQVAARDFERVTLVLINLSDTGVYVSPFAGVSTTRGIYLSPAGGSLTLNIFEDSILPAVEWFAISSAADKTLYRLIVRRETAAEEIEPAP